MQSSRKIQILCDGGLGNRVACLLAGIITAQRSSLTPHISWPSNNWCGCGFDDIFDMPDLQRDNQGINDIMRQDRDDIFVLHENQTNTVLGCEIRHGPEAEDVIANSHKDVVFYCARVPEHIKHDSVLACLAELRVNRDVAHAVDTFCQTNSIDCDVIGLHLRKTDCIKLDEDKWFDYVQHKGSHKRYFVCSDSQHTEQRFASLHNVVIFPKTHYVEKMIEGPWRQDRVVDPDGRIFPNNVLRNRQSVIQAWIDLLILSRTTIMPTVKSSFSRLALWIQESRREEITQA